MWSAEKTVKSSVVKASNPAKQLEVGKNRTKTAKYAGAAKTKGAGAESNGNASTSKQKSASGEDLERRAGSQVRQGGWSFKRCETGVPVEGL